MKCIHCLSCIIVFVISLIGCSSDNGGGMDGTGIFDPLVTPADGDGSSPIHMTPINIDSDGIRTGPIVIGSGNIDYGNFVGTLTQSGFTGTFILPTGIQGIEGQLLIGSALQDDGTPIVELELISTTIFRIPENLSSEQNTDIQNNIRSGNLYGRVVTNAWTTIFPFEL